MFVIITKKYILSESEFSIEKYYLQEYKNKECFDELEFIIRTKEK